MSHEQELDNLLKKIKQNHLETIKKLSALYKKAEELITEIKNGSENNLSIGLDKLKSIIGESASIRDSQIEKMQDNFKTILKSFLEQVAKSGYLNESQKVFDFNSIIPESLDIENNPFLKLSSEDAGKLVEVAKNSSEAMFEMFSRIGQIFVENSEKNNNS